MEIFLFGSQAIDKGESLKILVSLQESGQPAVQGSVGGVESLRARCNPCCCETDPVGADK